MKDNELAWIIRRETIEMTHLSGGSHIASMLSVADVLAVLYNSILNVDSKNPKSPDRDRFILSKGHAGGALYVALAEKGFISKDILKTHYQNGSVLSGHVTNRGIDGVELSTGSLGHGLSVGAGMAYSLKYFKNSKAKVYVVLGDGECDEGSVWEAALFSQHFELNNLVAIVDCNKMQSLTFCEQTIKLQPFKEKWESFNWNVIVVDGNDCQELKKAFLSIDSNNEKPTVILAETTKGKGVSFMENNILWHYRYPHDDEYIAAIKELNSIRPSVHCMAPCEEKK